MANPIQYSFQRYELKYLLTPEQYAALLPLLEPWVVPDTYGRYSISSIYYDTPDWRLIRASIEKKGSGSGVMAFPGRGERCSWS